MEVKELRDCNLIKFKGATNGGTWYDKKVDLQVRRYINNHGMGDFQPIPLTEDWLIKFGFEIIDKFEESSNIKATHKESTLELDYNINGFWVMTTSICTGVGHGLRNGRCEYVHQLQNLIHALTGKELEIKES